ncbi:hypothetical protein M9Y10_024114 [Tritrichomonas musculus]|uniref:Uncharacterized protein n=1 Tax=Tritrichomonas musculus TaxID=1915356 RepID=A0ABR2KX15_9EUKA
MEEDFTIYLIPEVQSKQEYFFAKNAQKVHPLPITIVGYRTWLLTSSLDCFCEPYSLVAVPEANQKAKLYKVRFTDSVPDFKSYGLQVVKTPDGNVICMSTEKFWEIEARSLCIPLDSTKWKAKPLFYHALTALFHLGIIPTLSENTFLTVKDLSKYESDLNAQYGTETPLQESLHYIFKSTMFALIFFGFATIPAHDKKTAKYFEFTKKLMEEENGQEFDSDTNKYFAFTQIGFAIANYNNKCQMQPSTQSTNFMNSNNYDSDNKESIEEDNGFVFDRSNQILSGYSYKMLIKSVSAVIHLLTQLGYTITNNESLIEIIKQYQNKHSPTLRPTGICDPKTLRVLWDESVSKSMALPVILERIGCVNQKIPTNSHKKLLIEDDDSNSMTSKTQKEKFKKNSNFDDDDNDDDNDENGNQNSREYVKYQLNNYIESIPDYHTYELLMQHQIKKDLNEITMRCVALRQRIDEIRLRTNSSKEMISLVTQMNNNCDELLNQSLQSLSDILKSHMKAQEKFEEIKSYISIQRRTNHIFSFCGLIFLLIYFLRIFHIYPFN